MIHTCIPYCPPERGKDLGFAYNAFMEMLGPDDWACFIDHDAMFTTDDWYVQISSIVSKSNSKIGLLSAVTNRIGVPEQRAFPIHSDAAYNHDMYYHRKIGKDIMLREGTNIKEVTSRLAGVVMVVPKRAWKDVGGFNAGFLDVDVDFGCRLRNGGYKTCLMSGVYVYHWYRAAPTACGLKPRGYTSYLPPI